MIVPGEERLRFPCYRCDMCGKLLTRRQIARRWQWLTDNPVEASKCVGALCACGSRVIRPTNPKLWEELLLPSVWELWWHEFRPMWLGGTYAGTTVQE